MTALAVGLAALAAAGLAVVAAIEWPAVPAPTVAASGGPVPATNPWLAAARGELALARNEATPTAALATGARAVDASPVAGPPRLRISAPARLAVGEVDEVVVSLDAPARVGRLSFKVVLDGDVLQARLASAGDWSPDSHAAVAAAIAPGDDVVTVDARTTGDAAGSVVRIRVQAMAAGATQVRLTDVVSEDASGRPLALVQVNAGAAVIATAALPVTTADAARGREVGDMSAGD